MHFGFCFTCYACYGLYSVCEILYTCCGIKIWIQKKINLSQPEATTGPVNDKASCNFWSQLVAGWTMATLGVSSPIFSLWTVSGWSAWLVTYNSFMYLSLLIPLTKNNKIDIHQCLDVFVRMGVMEKADAWYVSFCGFLSLSKLKTQWPPAGTAWHAKCSTKQPRHSCFLDSHLPSFIVFHINPMCQSSGTVAPK
jgi:hypothetical protein